MQREEAEVHLNGRKSEEATENWQDVHGVRSGRSVNHNAPPSWNGGTFSAMFRIYN